MKKRERKTDLFPHIHACQKKIPGIVELASLDAYQNVHTWLNNATRMHKDKKERNNKNGQTLNFPNTTNA